MKQKNITYVVSAAFMAFTAFFYAFTFWVHIQLPRYYPLERTWKWVHDKGVPSQAWYGMQAFAYLSAGVCTLILYFFLKRRFPNDLNLKPGACKALGVIATLIVVICLGMILYHEFHKWGVVQS